MTRKRAGGTGSPGPCALGQSPHAQVPPVYPILTESAHKGRTTLVTPTHCAPGSSWLRSPECTGSGLILAMGTSSMSLRRPMCPAPRADVALEADAASGQGVDYSGTLHAEALGLKAHALLPVVSSVPLRKREDRDPDRFVACHVATIAATSPHPLGENAQRAGGLNGPPAPAPWVYRGPDRILSTLREIGQNVGTGTMPRDSERSVRCQTSEMRQGRS